MAPRALPARCMRLLRAALLAWSATLATGCDGALVNLGNSERPLTGGNGGSGGGGGTATAAGSASGGAPTWNEPAEIVAKEDNIVANGTLDAGMTELFYTLQSRRTDALTSIYRADGPDFKAGSAIVFDGLTMADEVSPAVSARGTELWLGMLGASGNTDIYVSTGESGSWSKPALVAELSSPDADDAPRPPAVNDTLMPLSSKRHGGNLYQIYLSERSDASSPWGDPSQDKVQLLNSPSFQTADGFLNENGTELYFSSTRDSADGHSDLYVATRASLDAPFGEPEPLGDLNLPDYEERMPWLSPDEKTLYFASNRSGDYALYVTSRVAP